MGIEIVAGESFIEYPTSQMANIKVTSGAIIGDGDRKRGVPLHTASPTEIWINQSALSRRQKLYCPDVITQT